VTDALRRYLLPELDRLRAENEQLRKGVVSSSSPEPVQDGLEVARVLFRAFDDERAKHEPGHEFDVVLEEPQYRDAWRSLGDKAIALGARLNTGEKVPT
jgi:hypothetical protein